MTIVTDNILQQMQVLKRLQKFSNLSNISRQQEMTSSIMYRTIAELRGKLEDIEELRARAFQLRDQVSISSYSSLFIQFSTRQHSMTYNYLDS